ncbi:MAG: aquaporin [Candidatus Saccharibacteria bacterium]|nr:aquaporin [Candidatus Saccharibacteria bacterium]
MANTKSSKKTTKKSATKPKTVEAKLEESKKVETVEKIMETKQKVCLLKGFFARKYDANENILTIFKTPRIWGALAGELIGTMLLAMLLLTLGVYQPLYLMFGMIGITMAVYAISGAHLNPVTTVGMMATRRVSAIRGVLYIVAQVVGAWLGMLVVNSFRLAGNSTAELPVMAKLVDETLLACLFIEFMGAMIIGFFFNRAQSYKTQHGAFTYAAMAAGGLTLAVLLGIVISGNFLKLQNNFMMNPAIAIMFQIFPSSAENFGALIGQIWMAFAIYMLLPMIGGVIGAYLSELTTRLAVEEKA